MVASFCLFLRKTCSFALAILYLKKYGMSIVCNTLFSPLQSILQKNKQRMFPCVAVFFVRILTNDYFRLFDIQLAQKFREVGHIRNVVVLRSSNNVFGAEEHNFQFYIFIVSFHHSSLPPINELPQPSRRTLQ